MTLKRPLQLLLVSWISSVVALPLAFAQQHEERHEERHDERHDERQNARNEERHYAPRPAPPKWQAHPPGAHPHGPIVRQHPVRVLAPRPVKWGTHPWRHWEHPEFTRPVYYWDWAAVRTVSCTAEDSYGDQYPVTQTTFAGFGLNNMSAVEDEALDRCYSESGGDQSCFINSCSHF
jgi:hypothetical protein